MGDFVKGRPESLNGHFPVEVITGIRQHRATDRFTDTHPTFKEAKALLAPERRRMAGIAVDVYYDYLLSNYWLGGDLARRKFITHCHEILEKRRSWLPENFIELLPTMISDQWLESYSTIDGIALTFRRISTRSPAIRAVHGAEEDFIKHQDEFENLYSEFFPDLLEFTNDWKANDREGKIITS